MTLESCKAVGKLFKHRKAINELECRTSLRLILEKLDRRVPWASRAGNEDDSVFITSIDETDSSDAVSENASATGSDAGDGAQSETQSDETQILIPDERKGTTDQENRNILQRMMETAALEEQRGETGGNQEFRQRRLHHAQGQDEANVQAVT